MTRVDFHSKVQDKILYSCRLIRKARAANCEILVLSEDAEQASQLNRALWSFSASDFLPHVMLADPLSTQTPIIITTAFDRALPHHNVLINLSQRLPENFTQFARVIEVVSQHEDDADSARQRFRLYQQQGIKPSHIVAAS
ncbi:DNA polymerase III subunit chi [Undibacterium amnicola]|uniref:DNA polymerase III subunit chi n=1 Tax=Undibacterium amnicola TaxID=1834038 RepID=A0ABR6XMU0_9BURK|nr:DNA polymerase III subunit chi [Undibacterium amnicola]MBC3830831.1 DNA polymerase III subunit chi [Undibacterium amnicola]